MTVKVIGRTFNQYAERLKKPPMDKMLKAGKDDLVKESTSHGWKRFVSGIETVKDSETKGRIFVNDDVVPGQMQQSGLSAGMNNFTATNKQIAGWLHWGRKAFGPKTAKVLSWIQDGKRVFSMWVKATNPTNWWGLKEATKEKIRNIFRKNNRG